MESAEEFGRENKQSEGYTEIPVSGGIADIIGVCRKSCEWKSYRKRCLAKKLRIGKQLAVVNGIIFPLHDFFDGQEGVECASELHG